MGPPSSGGVHIIQMLNILENYDLTKMGHNSPTYTALLTESMKYAYADRSKYLGDPQFFDVPVQSLISKEYAKNIFKKINAGRPRLYVTRLKTVIPTSNIPKLPYINHEDIIDAERTINPIMAGNAINVASLIDLVSV